MPTRIPFDPGPRHRPSRARPVRIHLRLPPPHGHIAQHQHVWGQITCPLNGCMRIVTMDQAWIVPAGRAIWIPPGMAHEVAMFGAADFHVLYIHRDASPLPSGRCAVIHLTPLIRELVLELAQEPTGKTRAALMTQLLLVELGSAPLLALGLALPRDRRLKALCMKLLDEPESRRTLAAWATEAGASPRTLARLFSDELGTSFAAWRRQARIARAADLLGRGLAITDVALAMGYTSPPAFSTMFRKMLGMSPSAFAKTGAAGREAMAESMP